MKKILLFGSMFMTLAITNNCLAYYYPPVGMQPNPVYQQPQYVPQPIPQIQYMPVNNTFNPTQATKELQYSLERAKNQYTNSYIYIDGHQVGRIEHRNW